MGNSVYHFLGTPFLRYVDSDTFKERVIQELGYNNEPFEIPKAYKEITDVSRTHKRVLDKILFENILYGKLRNIFIDSLDYNPNLDESVFKKRMDDFIKHINHEKLDSGLERFMSSEGFYLMESISNTKIGTLFLAGFDYTKDKDNKISTVRMLFSNVVPLKEDPKVGYFLAGVDINLIDQTSLVMIRNITNEIDKQYDKESDDADPWEESLIKFYNIIKQKVFPLLGLRNTISFKKDRKAMFKMCKELDSSLLNEFRDEMKRRFSNNEIEASVDTLLNKLMPTGVSPGVAKKNLVERFEALLLSTYITTISSDEELIEIAKDRKLVGFPVNISFKSGKSSKGSAGTSLKNMPIAGEIMFHSLYADFNESLELPQWSISWFTDFQHQDVIDIEVIQTTIKSTKNYLLLTFKDKGHLNEGLIKHVVGYISDYRKREAQNI